MTCLFGAQPTTRGYLRVSGEAISESRRGSNTMSDRRRKKLTTQQTHTIATTNGQDLE